MSQRRVADVLKAACWATALLGLVPSVWGGPMMAEALQWTLGLGRTAGLGLKAVVLMTAGLCYLALWRFYQVALRIGQDRSFTAENARAMAAISRALGLAALLMLLFFLLWWLPLLWRGHGLAFVMVFLPLLLALVLGGLSLLCWALQTLLARAASLQEAQDLTI